MCWFQRAAVVLSACRGKTWESKPSPRLGPLMVLLPYAQQALSPCTVCSAVLCHRALQASATDHTPPAAQSLSVPQSWFAHFYDVGAAVNLAVLASLLALATGFTTDPSHRQPGHLRAGSTEGPPSTAGRAGGPALLGAGGFGGVDAAVAPLALLQLHLTRRLAEANWLARYPPGARMHAIAYLFGLRCALACAPVLPCNAMLPYPGRVLFALRPGLKRGLAHGLPVARYALLTCIHQRVPPFGPKVAMHAIYADGWGMDCAATTWCCRCRCSPTACGGSLGPDVPGRRGRPCGRRCCRARALLPRRSRRLPGWCGPAGGA